MSTQQSPAAEAVAMRAAAAIWTTRRERGLSATESIEFELWLAADPRHAAAMRTLQQAWTLIDRTPESLAQCELATLARRRKQRHRLVVFSSLAAAAALVVAAVLWHARPPGPERAVARLVATGPREVTLADGSLVRLNDGSEIVEEFERVERRVYLRRGEAHFTVEKNPARPFVVIAGDLRVQAVGTAFNVNLQSAQIEVLVTEGKVSLANTGTAGGAVQPLVTAGERAVLAHGRAAPEATVTRVEPAAIREALAWRDSLVRLGGASLAEVAQDFERRFGARMIIAEPELAALQAGGRLRGDDPESFAKALATTFDLEVERAADGTWVLRKKSSNSR